MDTKKLVIIYWILLLIPSVAGGLAAFKLLGHEQDRINNNAKIIAEQNGETIAGSINIKVETMEKVLLEYLYNIQADKAEKKLILLMETNPLIRNFFIWEKKSKFIYPVGGIESTPEERKFLKRFEPIFQNNPPWRNLKKEVSVAIKNQNDQILYLNKSRAALSYKSKPYNSSGFFPCFTEDKLHIIGWVRKKDRIFGIELEFVTIISRIISDFSSYHIENATIALLNGKNEIIHQSDSRKIKDPLSYDISIPLSKTMPHWAVAVYTDKGLLKHGKSFFYISLIISLIFFTAIISGGWILVWSARKNLKDAAEKVNFVSSVSHELKTPLTSIRMYAELLQSERIQKPEKKKHYLGVIVSESRRLTRLINNVLDFSRIEQGKKRYNIEFFDLGQLIHDLMSVNKIRIEKGGLDLELDLPEGDTTIKSDKDCIEQAILNIIDNALKYASEGKVLKVKLYHGDSENIIIIEDRGEGIPFADREKIFDQFHRIDNSLTRKKSGTGLGLSISRRLIRDIGGDLYLETPEKRGSRFIIKLPL